MACAARRLWSCWGIFGERSCQRFSRLRGCGGASADYHGEVIWTVFSVDPAETSTWYSPARDTLNSSAKTEYEVTNLRLLSMIITGFLLLLFVSPAAEIGRAH